MAGLLQAIGSSLTPWPLDSRSASSHLSPTPCLSAPAKKKDKILTMDPSEITYEMVNRKMREIIATRGRRGTDKQEQVRLWLGVCCIDAVTTTR